MDPRDALPIRFCFSPKVKTLVYIVILIPLLLFARGWQPFLLLLLPFLLDMYGTRLVRANHPAFLEDVLDTLKTECLRACGVGKGDPHYSFHECEGRIDHWRLHGLASEVRFDLMAPKSDMVVLATRTGRIFPPKTYRPRVTYVTADAGTRDIYYADITAVELSGCELKMTTASGETVTYTGRGEHAAEAVERLRERLRAFKSHRPDDAASTASEPAVVPTAEPDR